MNSFQIKYKKVKDLHQIIKRHLKLVKTESVSKCPEIDKKSVVIYVNINSV